MNREHRTRVRLIAAFAVLGAACAHKPHPEVTPSEVLSTPDSVFITVINDNYYDARIHAIYDGGARHALGTIGGNERQGGLAIPWQPRPLAFEVILLVDGRVYRSEEMNVPAGDLVLLRLPPNIESSMFFRRVSR
jgi:hypothetical protein